MFVKILAGFIPIKALRGLFRNFCYSIQVRSKAKSIGQGLHCSKFSTVNKNTKIGNYVRLNGCHISGNGNVDIGNYSVLGFGSLIISDNHNYQGTSLPYDDSFITKNTLIGNFVWIGARAIILPGSEIGEGAIIQAGAVVHGKIPPLAVAGGNPAIVYKYRNIKHYQQTKSKMQIANC